jgi:hypothetical protein
MNTRLVATGMIATHLSCVLHGLFSRGLHPDAVEESRIEIHDYYYEVLCGGRKLIEEIK